MAKYVYIVDYDLKRKFADFQQSPICVYDTFESAKKRVDAVYEENLKLMKEALDNNEYTFEEHRQRWPKKKLEGDKEGWCYTRQVLAKCDFADRVSGDEVAEDLQVSVIKIEFHPE